MKLNPVHMKLLLVVKPTVSKATELTVRWQEHTQTHNAGEQTAAHPSNNAS